MEETAQNFYKQILEFHSPSKILCHTSKLWNFVKIIGPYSPAVNQTHRLSPILAYLESEFVNV